MNMAQGYVKSSILFLVLLFCTAGEVSAQPVPMGGNLYGEPITGSTTSGGFISTSSGIYQNEGENHNIYGPDYYSHFYRPPGGAHVVGFSLSTIHFKDNTYKDILHIQLSDGTIVNLPLHAIGNYYKIDSVWTGSPARDSTEWKKLTGDAVYALGTPWSSSSPLLWVSRDSMRTWQIDTAGLMSANLQDVSLDTAQYAYGATDHGLFKENPDSNVWHKVTSFTQATNLTSVFVDRENRILVAGSGSGLYLSTDNGTSWSSDASGVGTYQVNLLADDAFHNLYVTASQFAFSTSHVYVSAGGTGAWHIADTSISRIVGNTSFQTMSFNSISGDSILVAGTSFGVFLSSDQGTTWTMNNSGIRAEHMYGMARTGSGKTLLSTALGIFSNTPPDTSWNKTYPQNGFESSLPLYHDTLGNIYTTDPAIPLTSGNGATAVVKSTDGGASWSPDTAGLSAVNGGTLFYIDEAGGQHSAGYKFSTANMYVWSKPLNGSWTIDTTGFPTSGSYPVSMTSDRNGYLYVSGTISTARVLRRPIGGGTWVVDTSGIPQSVNYFGNMTPGTGGDVFGVVGYYGPGLMRRSAGTWRNFSLPPSLASQYITGVCVDKSGVVFVAFVDYYNAPVGVYFTTDNGASWTHAGLDSVYVTSLVSFGDSTYALSSNAGAFYVGKNPSVTNGVQTASSPRSFELFQNYPNPFNPTTAISFQLPAVSKVSLKIYDLLGRQVETLVNREMTPGVYQVSFDGSKLASGVYFYRLRAGNFVQTRKLLLLK